MTTSMKILVCPIVIERHVTWFRRMNAQIKTGVYKIRAYGRVEEAGVGLDEFHRMLSW